MKYIYTFLACLVLSSSLPVGAQEYDPLDPFSYREQATLFETEDPDENKTAEELLREALLLQQDDHLLDSRTKLLKALHKDPRDFRIHIALADYYTRHVGHFRLALKYGKQAEKLFLERAGNPPYQPESRNDLYHADILMLLSQARLNLDDYQGSLDTLAEYERLGYESSRLPASKAWILMKLGRLEEAIKIARAGLMAGANPGHTLNILGILLSMTGERQASLDVFREALRYELALGSYGNPSTPLNNSGEVYKETFDETNAKKSWLRAMQLPDGCEHVLPSLNLALIYLDELNALEAKKAIDNFESCFAQFPLRNGEEHKALVHLARGRIALHSGHIDLALEHLEKAQQRQQWFGKIGTNLEDLQVAIHASLALALRIKNNHLRARYNDSLLQELTAFKDRAINHIRALWLERKARQILTVDLEALEDLYVRHTDSMIEYPSFGSLLATFPKQVVSARVKDFKREDSRGVATHYYNASLAEIELKQGNTTVGLQMLEKLLPLLRSPQDTQLQAHLLGLKLGTLGDSDSYTYIKTAYDLLIINPAALRNAGGVLTVNYARVPAQVVELLEQTNLRLNNKQKVPLQVQYERSNNLHSLKLISELQSMGTITVKASSLEETINKFLATIFTKNIL